MRTRREHISRYLQLGQSRFIRCSGITICHATTFLRNKATRHPLCLNLLALPIVTSPVAALTSPRFRYAVGGKADVW